MKSPGGLACIPGHEGEGPSSVTGTLVRTGGRPPCQGPGCCWCHSGALAGAIVYPLTYTVGTPGRWGGRGRGILTAETRLVWNALSWNRTRQERDHVPRVVVSMLSLEAYKPCGWQLQETGEGSGPIAQRHARPPPPPRSRSRLESTGLGVALVRADVDCLGDLG